MNCKRANPLLSAYLDEALPARQAGAVAGHLARCAACRVELDLLERACRALDTVPPRTPPIDLWERFQARLDTVGGVATSSRLAQSPERRAQSRRPGRLPWLAPTAAAAAGLAAFLFGLSTDRAGAPVWTEVTVTREAPVAAMAAQRTPERAPIVAWAPPTRFAPIEGPEATPKITPPPAPSPTRRGDRDRSEITGSRVVQPSGPPPRVGEGAAGEVHPPAPSFAEVIQASVETTMRQQVADEVALLAQALSEGAAHEQEPSTATEPGNPS